MYKEFGTFIGRFIPQKAVWKDGELWTALLGGITCYFWFDYDANVIPSIRKHFGDILGVTSIIFGFALAALLFYVQAAGTWSNNKKVIRVANKIIDRHVWTIICLLGTTGYIVLIWSVGKYLAPFVISYKVIHSLLGFFLLYTFFQILNHTLTVWWSFINRDKLS